MTAVPLGALLIALLSVSVYLGWTVRVLQSLRLSRPVALVLLWVMFLGSLLAEPRIFGGLAVDLGGALVPAGVAFYLVLTASTRKEKARALLSALAVASALLVLDRVLPREPGLGLVLDPDPLLSPAILAALLGYGLGRSHRGAFVAATLGVIGVDLLAWLENLSRGLEGATVLLGGAGIFDATIIAGVLAVALTQLAEEIRGHLAGERRTPSRRILPTLLSLLLVLALLVTVRLFPGRFPGQTEVSSSEPYSLVDAQGQLLLITSRRIVPGDIFIDHEGTVHQVVAVCGRLARTRIQDPPEAGIMEPGISLDVAQEETETVLDLLREFLGVGEPPAGADSLGLTALYHTHNAESYLPSDGTDSVYGPGGVHRVGRTLAQELESRGIPVVHSENLHLPHDRGAYRRSRRTAVELIRLAPTILLDIHRDAAPSWVYAREIEQQPVTAIALVVGAYNPAMGYNRAFAQRLKNLGQEIHPGLIRGILVLNGNYNQDLGPRTLLLEVGAHTNTREAAERSMVLFADVLHTYLQRLAEEDHP